MGLGIEPSSLDAQRMDEIHACLDRLLESPAFASHLRRGQLLRHLIQQTLAGKGEEITEYSLGLDVFKKRSSFDTRIDSTVRARMSRLRKALAEYYQTRGRADPWRLELAARGYAACITPNSIVATPPEQQPTVPPRPPRRRVWIVAFGAVLILMAVIAWRIRDGRQQIGSVVVLLFENLTGSSQNEYLAEGVTEELTDSLAHIPALRVVARTSAYQFKGKAVDVREIGRRLNVDALVEGSVRFMDGKLRLTVQVNRTADGYHIVSQIFEGGREELGRLENDLVTPVLAAIRPGLRQVRHYTPDAQARELYMKAYAWRGQGTEESFHQALLYLRQAVQRDPAYADAYAAMAGVYAASAGNFESEPRQVVAEVKAAAGKAIELDPFCARAYAAQGYVDSLVLLDWKRGEQELRNAARMMPQDSVARNWLGLSLLMQGRFGEALSYLKQSEELDPLTPGPGVTVGLGYYMARQYEEALRQLTRVARLHPEAVAVHGFLGAAWEAKGQFDKAMAEYNLALPKTPLAVRDRMAHLLAVTGKEKEARQMLDALEHPPSDRQPDGFSIAIVHAALGDRDAAFAWLERAYECRRIALLKVHPMLDPLRGDPRFGELLKKAGFEP